MEKSIVVAIVFVSVFGLYNARMIRECPQTYSSYYLADDTDPCVFYWCLEGALVSQGAMACAPGSGVPPRYEGEGNPCTRHISGCSGSSNNGHHGNSRPGYGQQPNYGNTPPSYGQNSGQQPSYGQNPGQQPSYGHNPGQQPSYGQNPGQQPSYGQNPGQQPSYGQNPGQQPSYGQNPGQQHPNNPNSNKPSSGYGNVWVIPVPVPAPSHVPAPVPAPVPQPAPVPVPVHSPGAVPAPGPAYQGSGGHAQGGHYAATAYLTQHAHVPGGQLQPHVNSLRYCWKACVYSFLCKGFDFDTHYGTCWLHTDDTVCNELESKPYVNSYRLIHCPSSTTSMDTTTPVMMTTTESTTTTDNTVTVTPVKTPVANFTGMHLQGGTLFNGPTTLENCFAACQAASTCQGVDYDTNGNTCWLHTLASECGTLVAKATCTHYRCVQCDTPVVFPTSHALGGTLVTGVNDPTMCFALCINTCIAVDFDSNTMTCWHHTTATCAALALKPQCVHFRRPGLPCP